MFPTRKVLSHLLRINHISMLILLIGGSITLSSVTPFADVHFEKIELKNDHKGEKENTAKEISDNLEIDEFSQPMLRNYGGTHYLSIVHNKTFDSKQDDCRDTKKPPPKTRCLGS